KHLSYSGAKARQMAGWAQELRFPLLAGSAAAVTWRRPELELPPGAPVEEALVAAYGPVGVDGFDALEALQAVVERRGGAAEGGGRRDGRAGGDLPDGQRGVAGRGRGAVELGPAGGRPGPQRDGQPRRRPPQRRPPGRGLDAADAGDGLPGRVPRRPARHGAAAQRPRAGLHLRRPAAG